MTTTARTVPASPELTAAWASWDDPFHPTTDTELAELVALLMAAPLRTEVGGLIVDTGGWSRAQVDAVDADHVRGTDAWRDALNATPYVRVTLTDDGGPANRGGWCECPDIDGTDWVRYEHWTTEGIGGGIDRRHGFVCPRPDCRKITQTG
jgi:hypothetical protein